MKCCKNRCGALACQKPDVEVAEFADESEDFYNNPRNPYINSRDPNNYLRYYLNN